MPPHYTYMRVVVDGQWHVGRRSPGDGAHVQTIASTTHDAHAAEIVRALTLTAKTPPDHVRQFLNLSTNHLPQQMFEELAGEENVVFDPTKYGGIMWVPDEWEPDCAPAEVLAIWEFASALDCHYVLFDGDADKVDGLPVWEW